jgi:bifunctional non-homologous end joining protein LigD
MLPRITPIAPTRIKVPFDHEDWCFEIKMDGWRCTAYVEEGSCELVSRNGNAYKSFARLTKEMAGLPVKNAIIDSEVVCLDGEGKSVFLDLMRRRKAEAILYCFDLLWLDGEDLRSLSLLERKGRLQRLVRGHAGLLYAEHIEAKGVALFQAICAKDLEGIVCKHRQAPYVTTPATWFKVLNPSYTQKRGRQEMFEGFRTKPENVPA